jgi:hypothetical protein
MRKTLLCCSSLVGFLLGIGAACDPGAANDCQPGSEGCFCAKDYACLTGLVCLSERCVDPDGEPVGNDDSGNGDDSGGGDDSGDGADSGDTAPDNVGACEGWVESAECGDYDWSQSVDCSAYANYPCDIADYFNCLNENTSCTDGIPDTTGWTNCAELATCA